MAYCSFPTWDPCSHQIKKGLLYVSYHTTLHMLLYSLFIYSLFFTITLRGRGIVLILQMRTFPKNQLVVELVNGKTDLKPPMKGMKPGIPSLNLPIKLAKGGKPKSLLLQLALYSPTATSNSTLAPLPVGPGPCSQPAHVPKTPPTPKSGIGMFPLALLKFQVNTPELSQGFPSRKSRHL